MTFTIIFLIVALFALISIWLSLDAFKKGQTVLTAVYMFCGITYTTIVMTNNIIAAVAAVNAIGYALVGCAIGAILGFAVMFAIDWIKEMKNKQQGLVYEV
jgi:H+/gluconate symporter-like permease